MVGAPIATGDHPACAKVAHFSPPLWHVKPFAYDEWIEFGV
jgi:hypothetical protein